MSSIYVSLKKPPASLWCADILRGHPYLYTMSYEMIDITPITKTHWPNIELCADGEENLNEQRKNTDDDEYWKDVKSETGCGMYGYEG